MACGIGFISQATDMPPSLTHQLSLLAVMLRTPKGETGAAGGALVKLAATLQSSGALPLAGVGLLRHSFCRSGKHVRQAEIQRLL